MKKILVGISLAIGAVGVFTSETSASDYTYTIDCSADTDPSEDNSDQIWVAYEGPTEVLTTNCAYSCALGETDPNMDCGSAFFDNFIDRTYVVNGHGFVNAYVPGSYGQTLLLGATADELNFTATPGEESVVFSWDEIEGAVSYNVELYDELSEDSRIDADVRRGLCIAEAPTTTCTIDNLTPGVTNTFRLSIGYSWYSYYQQDNVASIDIAAGSTTTTSGSTTTATSPTTTSSTTSSSTMETSDELANSGSRSQDGLALALVTLMMGSFLFLISRQKGRTR